MSTCRSCTAPITWAITPEGEKVPLDDHEQHDIGPSRYRIVEDGSVPVVAAVAEESPARAFVDHRSLCGQPRAL